MTSIMYVCARRRVLVALLSAAVAACVERPGRVFAPDDASFAKGGNGGGGGGALPTVTAADPSEAPQDVTLDVRVLGTNFDNGSSADFLLNGKTTTKVQTNSTTFVSSVELRANVTIAIDADVDLYDIRVTTSGGKKGIGVERFAVTGPSVALPVAPGGSAPAGLYGDGQGAYSGLFVITGGGGGNGNFSMQPECVAGRSVDARLAWTVSGVVPTCKDLKQHLQFHLPGIYFADGTCAPPGCPIGGLPAGTNFGPTVNYYFAVDTNGDGRFGPPKDKAYNVVWTDAVYNVLRFVGVTPCQWRVTGGTADLYDGLVGTRLAPTQQAMALDVTVIRDSGVCG